MVGDRSKTVGAKEQTATEVPNFLPFLSAYSDHFSSQASDTETQANIYINYGAEDQVNVKAIRFETHGGEDKDSEPNNVTLTT